MTDNVLPEAGGIAWCEIYGKKSDDDGIHDVKINLTSRGFTAIEALDGLLEALKIAKEKYHLTPYMVLKQAPKFEAVSQTPALAAAAPAVIPVANEPVYENVAAEGTGTFHAVKMTVTPREGGKTKLDFFEVNHKFPDISAVMAPENLVDLMKLTGEWTVDHFMKATAFEVKYMIQWRNSDKLNSKGNPYKNIVGITAE